MGSLFHSSSTCKSKQQIPCDCTRVCAEERAGGQGPQTSCSTSSIRSSPNSLSGTVQLVTASPGFAAVSCRANPEWFGDHALQFDETPPDKHCGDRFNLLARTRQEPCGGGIACLQERAAPLTLFPGYGGVYPQLTLSWHHVHSFPEQLYQP